MVIEKLDISETLEKAKRLLREEKEISPAIAAIMEVLILLVTLLAGRLGRNSRNSSIPPSQDPNRARKKKAPGEVQKRKPGGQEKHEGVTLEKTETPDAIEEIVIDRRTIPAGRRYQQAGYESRQVVDLSVKVHVTEYRAEVLEDEFGKRYVAQFPKGVTKAVQYGGGVKAESVYLSQFQLVPLARVQEHFSDQMGLPLSKGSVSNFNQEAYEQLVVFEVWAKQQLLSSPLNHADETGINIGGKKAWLHTLSNDKVTLYHADQRRGKEAMDRMGVLPYYRGRLCHDHWKPYYQYDEITHVLCNAHHLRELQRAIDDDKQSWAVTLKALLLEINDAVEAAGGCLPETTIADYQKKYRAILKDGETQCPQLPPKDPRKRGKQAQSKSRNLLDRLRDFEADTLRFMQEDIVPFTNNQGENDLRMTKVQQKISGCFRSLDGAKVFCRIRGFLSTCRKNRTSPALALRDLFQGTLPAFMI